MSKIFIRLLFFFLLTVFVPRDVLGQASVKQVIRVMDTYPYSDPNPVPSLAINDNVSHFYPYSVFNGYTAESERKGKGGRPYKTMAGDL